MRENENDIEMKKWILLAIYEVNMNFAILWLC